MFSLASALLYLIKLCFVSKWPGLLLAVLGLLEQLQAAPQAPHLGQQQSGCGLRHTHVATKAKGGGEARAALSARACNA